MMRGCRNRRLPFSYQFPYVIRLFLLFPKGPLSCTHELSCFLKNAYFLTLIFRFLNGPKNGIENLGWLADFLLISNFVVDVMRSPVKKLWTRLWLNKEQNTEVFITLCPCRYAQVLYI
jgi:hypothetical protein